MFWATFKSDQSKNHWGNSKKGGKNKRSWSSDPANPVMGTVQTLPSATSKRTLDHKQMFGCCPPEMGHGCTLTAAVFFCAWRVSLSLHDCARQMEVQNSPGWARVRLKVSAFMTWLKLAVTVCSQWGNTCDYRSCSLRRPWCNILSKTKKQTK